VSEPVRVKTVKDRTTTRLRNATISGKLKPGQHLKETATADQLSASRSPVREAFHRLEQDGRSPASPTWVALHVAEECIDVIRPHNENTKGG
jgi:DNA-binding FadR family transcriptional regulator